MVQFNKAKKTILETGERISTTNNTSTGVTEMTGTVGAEERLVTNESRNMAEASDRSPRLPVPFKKAVQKLNS